MGNTIVLFEVTVKNGRMDDYLKMAGSLKESLANAEGFIRACAPVHAGFMGGGGNQEKFKGETGPAIAQMFKEEDVDAVVLTAG